MYLFAKGMDFRDISRLTPEMQLLLSYTALWCRKRDIDFYITSMIRSKKVNDALGSKSVTHIEGRAVDFSIRERYGWDYSKIQDIVNDLNVLVNQLTIGISRNPFYNIGAISSSDGQQRPIVIHKNSSNDDKHAHLQVRRF
jgi:hypothetical protein